MMRFSPVQPPGSVPCGRGSLVIQGATGVAGAEARARLGAREFVSAPIDRAVHEALVLDAVLARQTAEFRNPCFFYTLGPPTELTPESWSFPFEAFMSDEQPEE
jgi:hypothetical protein